jgi:hypothetical protein
MKHLMIVILCSCISMNTFSQTGLIGKWRRSTSNPHYKDTTHKQLEWGDLEIRPDASFHIQGDSSAGNSTIPGWNAGEAMNGTWELQNNKLLTLWLEPKESRMALNYIVVKLTKQELVLRWQLDKNNKKWNIKYLRL